MNKKRPESSFKFVANTIYENILPKVLIESIKMRLYDEMGTPVKIPELLLKTGLKEGVIESFLSLLEELELVKRRGEYWVNSTIAEEFLVSSSPFYQGDLLKMHYEKSIALIDKMEALLFTEAPPVKRGCGGKSALSNEYLNTMAQHSMRGGLWDVADFIGELPAFEEMETMCDIGGNHGSYSMEILKNNPRMVSAIADLPKVVSLIEGLENGIVEDDRISLLPFDLTKDSLPSASYDLILASHVLHMCKREIDDVLKRVINSLKPGGWLVIQNMDMGAPEDSRYRKTKELITNFMGVETHFLDSEKLKDSMQRAGLKEFRKGKSGEEGANYILAGFKR